MGRIQHDASKMNHIHVASKRMPNTGKSRTIIMGKRQSNNIRILLSAILEPWGTSFMPHLGPLPGASLTTSGCLGQV